MSNQRLAGQVAWISGATSGIGEAAARLFAQEGACVALVGRRVDLSQAIAQQINASGGRAMAIACDVAARRPAYATRSSRPWPNSVASTSWSTTPAWSR